MSLTGTINKPKSINRIDAICLKNTMVEMPQYTLNSFIATNANNDREDRVIKLTSYLVGIKSVIKSTVGSKLDCEQKIDLIVEYDTGNVVGFQVKTSKFHAELHTEKSDVGVIYLDHGYTPCFLLVELSRFLNVKIKQEIINVCKIAKLHKGKLLPLKILNLTSEQLEVLNVLKLAQIQGRNIKFN
jgi:hypothetical protein